MAALGVARVIKSKPQKRFANTFPFARALLSVALVSAIAPVYALETLSDASMSDATGEGIAYFATNFMMQMPSVANDAGSVGTAGTFGAGTGVCSGANPGGCGSYLYLSPIGPVALPTFNKVDGYFYGLSLSENTNANGIPVCTTPGTASTCNTTHNSLFSNTGINLGSGFNPFVLSVLTTQSSPGLDGNNVQVPVLQFAAPQVMTTGDPSYASSTNLRFGMWANFMQYNGATVNTNTNAAVGSAGPALQLQAIWDGLGINGTVIQAFPTPAAGVSAHPEYTSTLGLAGFLRYNSVSTGVLRLSVAETSMGVFDSLEGVYIPQLSENLPLGNANYQPLILGSGVTGTGPNYQPTITLELAQIPNLSNIYNQFYINYGCSGSATSYPGSSCTGVTVSTVNGGVSAYQSSDGYAYLDPSTNAAPVQGASLVIYKTSGSNTFMNYTGATGSDGTGAAVVGGVTVTGLTPTAGSCTSANCPNSATHGSITIGDVYVNNTTSNVPKTYTLTLNDGTSPNGTSGTPNASSTVTVTDIVPPGGTDALFNSAGNVANTNVNGITFMGVGSANPVNLGTAAISGMAINHMKMTLSGL